MFILHSFKFLLFFQNRPNLYIKLFDLFDNMNQHFTENSEKKKMGGSLGVNWVTIGWFFWCFFGWQLIDLGGSLGVS